jgi:hypothetical protein
MGRTELQGERLVRVGEPFFHAVGHFGLMAVERKEEVTRIMLLVVHTQSHGRARRLPPRGKG